MNPFQVLGLEERPWYEWERILEARRAWMEKHHPDQSGMDEAAAQVNEAARRLGTAGGVVREYLLLRGITLSDTARRVPAHLADLFIKLAGPMEEAGRLLQASGDSLSALERAEQAEQVLKVMDELQTLQAEIQTARRGVEDLLKKLDGGSDSAVAQYNQLEEIALNLAFLEKWMARVEQTRFRLAEMIL